MVIGSAIPPTGDGMHTMDGETPSDRAGIERRLLAICPDVSRDTLEEMIADICELNARLTAYYALPHMPCLFERHSQRADDERTGVDARLPEAWAIAVKGQPRDGATLPFSRSI